MPNRIRAVFPPIRYSNADCCTVGSGFESGEIKDICKGTEPLRHGGILTCRQVASSLMRLVEREKGGRLLTTSRVFSYKIGVANTLIYD
ncbi:hypothetical protein TNCV_3540181 [Trichonephila clavipes]|nr:hypothetical protein TNCV_3540181 [Trichonephila clavipes]